MINQRGKPARYENDSNITYQKDQLELKQEKFKNLFYLMEKACLSKVFLDIMLP